MGQHRVQLFALIWILACGGNAAINATVGNITDWTDATTPVVPASTLRETITTPSSCVWKIFENVTGSIWITLPFDSKTDNVTIQITNNNPKPDCQFNNNTQRITSYEMPAQLEVCPNENYTITIDCSENQTETFLTLPGPPLSITFREVTNTSFEVAWEKPSGSGEIIEYNVQVLEASENVVIPGGEQHCTIEYLRPYTNYTVQVSAKNLNKNSWGEYVEEHVMTTVGIPHSPSNLKSVHRTNTTVTLEWEEPTPSTGPVLKYIVEGRTLSEVFEEETPDNATRFEFSSLAPFAYYTFRVLAETEAGFGPWSNETEVQTDIGVPHAPSNLTSVHRTNTTVTLEWEEPTPSTGPVLKYIVEGRNVSEVFEVETPDNATRFEFSSLAPFTYYTFRVLAETDAGFGPWSKETEVQTDIGVPHAPANLTYSEVSNTSVLLTWEEPKPSTGPLTNYTVVWNDGKGGETIVINATELSFNVTDLSPYTNYTFYAAASTTAGRGNWSEHIEVQTDIGIPHPPTGLNHSGITSTSVLLTWEEPKPSTGPINTYTVHWNDSKSPGAMDINSTEVSYNLTGLLPYTNYTFQVAASTDAGAGNWSQVFEVQTSVGVPHPPTDLNQNGITNASVLLTWKEPKPSTGPIIAYTVHWKDADSSGTIDINSTKVSYNVIGLSSYVNYSFTVAASTEAGTGHWCEPFEAQTSVGVPHPPTDLNRSEVTNTSVLLTWKEPKPSTGPLNSYTVRWHSERSSGLTITNSLQRSFNATNLAPYSLYTFNVAASTKAGLGPWSAKFEIRTEIGVPTAPRNLRLEHSTDVSLIVKWDRPTFPNAPELNYSLVWRISSEMDSKEKEAIIPDKSVKEVNAYAMRGLSPYSNYSIRVFASTYAGRGPPSNLLEAETEIGVPQPAVILEAKPGPKRTALVRWSTPGDYPGPVRYSLQAWKLPGPCSSRKGDYVAEELRGFKAADEWHRVQTTEVLRLSPYGDYSFLIVLKTSATDGVDSEKSDFIRIPPEEPSEPQRVLAECINSPTQLNVSWGPPSASNGIIEYYNIEYGIEDQWRTNKVPIEDMCKNQSYILRELRPERRYGISVRAHVKGVRRGGKSARPDKVCTLPAGVPYLGNTSHLLAASAGPDGLVFEWTNHTFSDYMGALVRYTVLVGRLESLGNATSGRSASVEPPWSNFTSGASDFYQATPSEWNPFLDGPDPLKCQTIQQLNREGEINITVLRCFIGTQKHCLKNETYCNGPVDPDTPYEIKIRAFTRGGFTETDLLYARSGKLPEKSSTGTVVAIVISLFILLSLVGGGYVLRRKGYAKLLRENIISKFRPQVESPCRPLVAVQMQMAVASKHEGSQISTLIKFEDKQTPIRTAVFMEHVRIMMADCKLRFAAEFEELSQMSPKHPCEIAGIDENRPKNRYANIYPFDHSRVKLLPLSDEPGSDYINANYIPGYLSPREYIATQGPLPHTVDDFWRMVWEQSTHMIVMLTSLVERGKTKCEQYWPDSGEMQYFNDLIVTCVSESMLSSYTIRIFHLQLGSKERHVKQMHYTNWPDFGSPECPENFISFVSAVRDHLPRTAPGPLVVHCSAGVGRTGTFIAIDRLLRQLLNVKAQELEDEFIDIFGLVLELRNHRTNMVQAEDQYVYIHFCVQHLIQDDPSSPSLNNEEHIYSNVGLERDTQM